MSPVLDLTSVKPGDRSASAMRVSCSSNAANCCASSLMGMGIGNLSLYDGGARLRSHHVFKRRERRRRLLHRHILGDVDSPSVLDQARLLQEQFLLLDIGAHSEEAGAFAL